MLAQLPYHRMVLRESLRMYPAAPIRGRTLQADVTLASYVHAARRELRASRPTLCAPLTLHGVAWRCQLASCVCSGAVIPKGWDAAVNFYALHRHPAYWPDPEVGWAGRARRVLRDTRRRLREWADDVGAWAWAWHRWGGGELSARCWCG